jgi:Uma2 family endonuclease
MATVTPIRSKPAEGDQCVVLRDIGWAGYSTMLRLRGERGVPRMVYLDGDLYLMSPSFPHERLKERLGDLVKAITMILEIPSVTTAQTTFRRRKKRGGVEADHSFYIVNEGRIRGKDRINLRVDPPPDLAIEAVYSHDADAAVEVHRRLGVPEVWVCDQFGLTILVRQPDGHYAESPASAAFPFLTAAEVSDWVHRPQSVAESEWLRDVHRWVSETLAARRAGGREPR